MKNKIKRISVIGDGGWGTTLATYLAKKGYPVSLWGAFPDNVQAMAKNRFNTKFLPGVALPDGVSPTDNIKFAVSLADLIVLAVPSQYLRAVLKRFRGVSLEKRFFLSVIKGIETRTLMRMSQVIHQELGPVPLAVLSGPNIAMEVAQGIPSTSVIASHNSPLTRSLQEIFNSPTFRIYRNSDMVGVELGGSLKNIIAIASGVCEGLGFGTNTRAAILTRGIAEMARLGKALGGKISTFSGLAGLGDLITTCSSQQSRNRYVGEQLGKGKTISVITASMNNRVAEGVETTQAVYKLSHRAGVAMPIATEVYNIIYRDKSPQQAVRDLMTRKLKAE